MGVLENKTDVSKLLENRLPFKNGINIAAVHKKNIVKICVAEKNGIFALCDVLADILIENLHIKYIMRIIEKSADMLSEREKSDILITSIKKLWYGNTGAEQLEKLKKDVSNRIAVCVFEGAGIIFLDGVLNFRMKDCTSAWKKVVDGCIAGYIEEAERKDFVRLLRYFVSMRDPLETLVFLRPEGMDYILVGEDGNYIDVFSPGVGITNEDMLLSRLISISPEHIIIEKAEEFADKKLIDIIKQVFIGRVEIRESK